MNWWLASNRIKKCVTSSSWTSLWPKNHPKIKRLFLSSKCYSPFVIAALTFCAGSNYQRFVAKLFQNFLNYFEERNKMKTRKVCFPKRVAKGSTNVASLSNFNLTRQSTLIRWIATKALKPIISSPICDTLYNFSLLSQCFHFVSISNSHAKVPMNLFARIAVSILCKRRERKSWLNVFLCDCMLCFLFFRLLFFRIETFSISTKVDTFVVIIDHKIKLNYTSGELVIPLRIKRRKSIKGF